MAYTNLWLAQLQFFSSLAFMVVFLALELGLAWLLLYFKLRGRGHQVAAWTSTYRYWVRVFALSYVLAFAASIPVIIQSGSLWPMLMPRIGDVAGPLIAAGIVTAFVFKSCFLGAMLFGQRRLPPVMHKLAVLLVALGSSLALYWLLCLLAWMHTPVGAVLMDDHYVVQDWAQILATPALPWYAGLFFAASALTTAFFVMGMCAAQSLRRPVDEAGRCAFHSASWLAGLSLPLLALLTLGTGRVLAPYQPAKVAATLGEGLDRYAGMSPPTAFTYWSFRVALFVGACMIVVAAWTLLRRRQHHYDPGVMSVAWRYVLVAMTASGGVLLLAGLGHLLAGALPYVVSGTITLSEVAGESLPGPWALSTGLAAQLVLYILLIFGFIQLLRYMSRYGVVPVARHRGRA